MNDIARYCHCLRADDFLLRPQLLDGVEFVELRGDCGTLSPEQTAALCGRHKRLLYTYHTTSATEPLALEHIRAAVVAGAAWVDVEQTAGECFLAAVAELCKSHGVRLIISFHDYCATPSAEALEAAVLRAFALGADVAKVVPTAHSQADVARIMGLYGSARLAAYEGRIVAFAMGLIGRLSRPLSLILGAPWCYVRHPECEPTAPAQPTEQELDALLFAVTQVVLDGPLQLPREAAVPCSKSQAQRAIVAAVLATGVTRLEGVGVPADDVRSAMDVARALGCEVECSDGTISVRSGGLNDIVQRIEGEQVVLIDVGESALLARLWMSIFAIVAPKPVQIVGRGTLPRRDLSGTIDMLRTMGAECRCECPHLPVSVCASGTNLSAVLSDPSSSQGLSGLMMALPFAPARSLMIAAPKSRPYLSLTADVMADFGVRLELQEDDNLLKLSHMGGCYRPLSHYALQPDWSSAAYFAVAYAVAQSGAAGPSRVRAEGYCLPRMARQTAQADEVILSLLESCGANVQIVANGDKSDIYFMPSGRLHALDFDATHCPDLLPTLALLGLFCQGRSCLVGLRRLGHKESDRAEGLLYLLRAVGAEVEMADSDTLTVVGDRPLYAPEALGRAVTLPSFGDHRMAMVLILIGLLADVSLRIDSVECTAKSFPDFLRNFYL